VHSNITLGWSEFFGDQLYSHERGLEPVRISADVGQSYTTLNFGGNSTTVPAPRICGLERPAVGDWILIRPGPIPSLVHCLERRSLLVRQVAGRASEPQVIAANLDTVFIVTTVGADFNPRRIDRYLAAVAGSGIEAVIVLNKTDLDPDRPGHYASRLPRDVPTVMTSALLNTGMEDLLPWVSPGRTVGLIGSSGVGKSSIINGLLQEDRQDLGEVRMRDEQGQHTTSRRELMTLPGGAILVDTPGMRELGLWNDKGIAMAFSEIGDLESKCRFRDCEHYSEPGCAVLAAIATGDVSGERVDSWYTLRREADRHIGRREGVAKREKRKFELQSRRSVAKRDQKRAARNRRHERMHGYVDD
jgi:ribosome biogenesis GTPase